MYPNAFYRVSVKALVKNDQRQVLVVKENQDTWSLPGGGLDHGEDPEKGLLRELKEELGIDEATVKGILTTKAFYLESRFAWLLWIVYEVEVATGEFTYGSGVADARYLDASDLEGSKDIFERTVYEFVTS